MGDGLDQALVHAEGAADQILAVAGGGAAADLDAVAAEGVDLLKLCAHALHGVSLVGGVVGVEDALVLGDQHQLGGGAAAVHAQPGPAAVTIGVARNVVHRNRCLTVAKAEGLVVGLRLEQRPEAVRLGRALADALPDGACDAVDGVFLAGVRGVQARAQCHRKARVLGEDRVRIVQLQRLLEALAQPLAIVQRPAQKHDLSLDLSALGQARDGLVHHRLVDAGGHVRLAGTLVQQRLNVALGEHAAAGCEGVEALMRQALGVHLLHAHVQEHRHLVDERAGAARAAAVHALVQAMVEEDHLRVLAAQLDHHAGVRLVAPHGLAGGIDLLHEGDARGLGHAQTRRAADRCAEGPARQLRPQLLQQLQRLLAHLGEVALVLFI